MHNDIRDLLKDKIILNQLYTEELLSIRNKSNTDIENLLIIYIEEQFSDNNIFNNMPIINSFTNYVDKYYTLFNDLLNVIDNIGTILIFL